MFTFRTSVWLSFKPVWSFLIIFCWLFIFVIPSFLSLYVSYLMLYVMYQTIQSLHLWMFTSVVCCHCHSWTHASFCFCDFSLWGHCLSLTCGMFVGLNWGCFPPEISNRFCCDSGPPKTWRHFYYLELPRSARNH